jgi:hypothetical protein
MSKTEAAPGVVRKLTYKDLPVNEYDVNIYDQPVGWCRWITFRRRWWTIRGRR